MEDLNKDGAQGSAGENTAAQAKSRKKPVYNVLAPGRKFDYDAHMRSQLFVFAALILVCVAVYFLLVR